MSDTNKTPTGPKQELKAMTEIANALELIDSDSIRRVLIWAGDRFNVTVDFSVTASDSKNLTKETNDNQGSDFNENYENIADLYAIFSPKNDSIKALIVGYWFQVIQGQPDFNSATVNRELKHLGHGVSNITAALSSLMSRKPQLVIQTKKAGTSKQARKRYKITVEGIKQVDRMIGGED